MSSTIKTWYSQLSAHLHVKSLLSITTKTVFQDAKKLFGTNFDKKVTLREAEHLEACKGIILNHFDPHFQSTDVYCRHPSCRNINPEAGKRGKRDLYLCRRHRGNLVTSIEDALARTNIPKSTEVPKEEQFTGYTSFIGLLEGAYHSSKKCGILQKGELTPMIEEAILNVRNVLIITSTVLHSDENNLALLLPYVVQILKLILDKPGSARFLVDHLVLSLQKVIEMILSAFGVMYRWVSRARPRPTESGLGKHIGYVGAVLGGFTGAVLGTPFGPWAAVSGGVVGSSIGQGVGQLFGGLGQQAIDRLPVVYIFEGNISGGLYLSLKIRGHNNHGD